MDDQPTDPQNHRPAAERPVAVALRRDTDATPRVTASGQGAIAEQILRIALDRGVKVRADADLAHILAAVEVDSPIPLEALAAVAEILRYLYLLHGDAAPVEAQPQS